MTLEVCILAAGLGKRMKSLKPKVLHEIAGQPMLVHLLASVSALKPDRIHVVVGKGAAQVKEAIRDEAINWVLQAEQLGTGHAVMQVVPHLDRVHPGKLLILLGDAPLVTAGTMKRLVDAPCDLGVLTVRVPNPFNYGRIIRGQGVNIERIVEERDATPEVRKIAEINTGVMIADRQQLPDWLTQLNRDNDQGEYLLTDIVALAAGQDRRVHAVPTDDQNEARGVNDLEQLAVLEQEFRRRQAVSAMAAGIRLMDPLRFDLRGQLSAGQDTVVDINCVFEGKCELGDNVSIGPNCYIRDSKIGSNSQIRANSVIEETEIGAACIVGPFARLRPGTFLAPDVTIGNFVEVKKSRIGEGSKASHLTYLGDAIIGRGVNVGAGTITCNYDGVNKHETRINDDVFVGSNAALVAPVVIGEGATIAAGSTITKDVPPHQLAVARGKQRNIDGWIGPKGTGNHEQ